MSLPSSAAEATTITPVEGLPGYELLDMVGAGGIGTVYRARQLKLDRLVAVKMIRPDRADSPALAARFAAEAVMLGQLHHPHIVQVYDSVQHAGRLFIVMELLGGEDLGRRVLRAGRCDEALAWAVARQAAQALAHAAAHGIIHRDIKPENLFLVSDPAAADRPGEVPVVKVMDFGLAKWTADPAADQLTAPGTVLGTPAYMAPEQYRAAGRLDHRADIYSLGATVFHALAGKPPFAGATVWDVMAQKTSRMPRLGSDVPRDSVELVAAMMAPALGDRIGSYQELIDRIDRLRAARTTSSGGFGAWSVAATRGKRWAWAAVAGSLIASGAGIWAARDHRPTTPPTKAEESPATTARPALEPTGDQIALFDGVSLNGWFPTSGIWRVGNDDEGAKVLTGSGTARRVFEPTPNYRVTVGLDVNTATAVEVQFGVATADALRGRRHALRVTRADGAVFGTRDGTAGTFKPLGQTVPFPPAAWFEGRRPYLEVKVERARDGWTAWFNGREVGRADDPGSGAAELRLGAEGGSARIDSVVMTALREK